MTTTDLVPVPVLAPRSNGPAGSASAWLDVALQTDSAGDLDELIEASQESARNRHAENTVIAYDYWWNRFACWCGEPESRWRARRAPALDPLTLLPMDQDGERIVSLWLHDLLLGPVDDGDVEEWCGPPAPATYHSIQSALKARISDLCGVAWTPSAPMANVLKGLRRKARDAYGQDRQAAPLLAAHCAMIARMLLEEPVADLRDRLLVELTAANVRPGGIFRLRVASLAGTAGDRELIVPGQRRRGNKRDADVIVRLIGRPELEAALDAYLAARGNCSAGDALVALSHGAEISHLRKNLEALARRAGIAWRPTRATPTPSSGDAARLRIALAERIELSSLRRRRDVAMVWVAFFAALRRSELCALTIGDVPLDQVADLLIINIKKSKTDQDERGIKLPIHRPRQPIVAPHLDAVGLIAEWVRFMETVPGASKSTPLFPAIDRWGGLLVEQNDGVIQIPAMSTQAWSDHLRDLAVQAQVFGEDGDYRRVSGHSTRRGYVTSALLAGIAATKVAKQTRHKNLNEIQRYADELELLRGTNSVDILVGWGSAIAEAEEDLASGVACTGVPIPEGARSAHRASR